MRRIFTAGILLAATGAMGPRAQAEIGTESNPLNLSDTIVVTANRLGTSLRENATSITVINRQQIESSQAVMVSDLLRTAPGVDVVQSGGAGQQTGLFLRGANTEHVLVLIDGVEVNDPSAPSGAANLAHMPVDNIERIEILRGPQSVLYGSDAIAGVIQIFTRRGEAKPLIQFTGEAGAFGTYNEQLEVAGARKKADYAVSLARRDTDGISAAVADGNPERDSYRNTAASARAGWEPSENIRLTVSGRWTEAETDLDQSYYPPTPDDRNYSLESTERSLSGSIVYEPAGSRASHRVGAAIADFDRHSIDGTDEVRPSDTSQTQYNGQRVRFDWQTTVKAAKQFEVTLGAETENETMEQSLYYGSAWGPWADTLPEVSVRTNSGYGLARLSVADRWYTTAGVRRDDHRIFGGETTFRFTSAYLVDAVGLKLSATFGTGFKAPTLVQLYDNATGNRNLRPETSEGWEIGLERSSRDARAKVGATYFRTRFANLILFDGTMVNKATASIRGIELYGETDLWRLRVRADYTHTRARDDVDDRPLIRRPQHKLGVTIGGELSHRLLTSLRVSHVGSREDTDFNVWPYEREVLDRYTLVTMSAGYKLSGSVAVHARLENLLDENYEEALGFGSRPIALYGGVTLNL
jgi:vitamin B12 transporter